MKLLTRKKEAEIDALVEQLQRFNAVGAQALANYESALATASNLIGEMAKLSAMVSELSGRVEALETANQGTPK